MLTVNPLLAIWLDDIDRLPTEMRLGYLNGRLDLAKIYRVGFGEKSEEQPAVAFSCPLLEAALVCDLIRSHDRKVGLRPTEIYLSRSGSDDGFRRITYDKQLTIVIDGKTLLNPKVFSIDQEVVIEQKLIPKVLRKS